MKFSGILIGSEDPKRLSDYYGAIFGKAGWEDSGYIGWKIGDAYITVGPHDQVKGPNASPGRLIWNIETPDVKGEFERMKAAGAIVIREPYRPDVEGEYLIATLSDPDENYFQLMSPMPESSM